VEKPSFSVSTINPSVVFGPPVILPSSPAKLNETLRPIFSILSSGPSASLPPNIGSGSFVDVRDVAFMHLWAFENAAKADGERYIACAGFGPSQAAADVLRERYKGTRVGEGIVRGTPGEGYSGGIGMGEKVEYLPGRVQVSGKKAEREMGLKYVSFRKSILDTAEALEKLL
jgi:nucleoside-diphosphate-sugar epimerase